MVWRLRTTSASDSAGERHHLSRSLIGDHFVCVLGNIQAGTVSLADDNYLKGAGLQHAWECALPGVDGQLSLGVVPVERDGRVDAFLVVVVVVLVLVQREGAVGAGIDAQLDRIGWLLGGILKERTHRNDGAGAHHERDLVHGRIDGYALAAGERFSGPEIDPRIAGWEIQRSCLSTGLDNLLLREDLRRLPVEHRTERA